MTITLHLDPDIEQGLLAQAQAKGLSISDYVEELIEQQARQAAPMMPDTRTGQALIDVFAEIRGLFTDEEIDTMFARNRSPGRTVDLS
jgi:hypothetical protein